MRSSAAGDFTRRVSPREMPELMDGACSYDDFRACLRSLEQVNRWFLGYRPTLSWLERLPRATLNGAHLVDVGSGGGDLLRKIDAWARKRGIAIQLTGIDLNPYAKRAAEEATPKERAIAWVTGDALLYEPEKPIDLVVSSLMTHHLEDEEIVMLLRWMETTARIGWFINDLQRSRVNCRMFGLVAGLVGWHRFVQHDGPVSFQRAFCDEDWIRLLTMAGLPIETVTMKHWRPGRLCVGHRK